MASPLAVPLLGEKVPCRRTETPTEGLLGHETSRPPLLYRQYNDIEKKMARVLTGVHEEVYYKECDERNEFL